MLTMGDKKLLYDGFHKIEEVITEVKGKVAKRERLKLPSAVGGLVIDEDNRVAIVKQYRPTIGKTTYEIPAGVLDKGLTPVETLLEELAEECELYQEDIVEVHLDPFVEYYMVSGSSDARIGIYYIRVKTQAYKTKVVEEDNDVESIEWLTLEELVELNKSGLIEDAKTNMAFNELRVRRLEQQLRGNKQ